MAKTIEERAHHEYKKWLLGDNVTNNGFEVGYVKGATEQKAIDIDTIPQLYVRWLMIEGEKPKWAEYARKAMEV